MQPSSTATRRSFLHFLKRIFFWSALLFLFCSLNVVTDLLKVTILLHFPRQFTFAFTFYTNTFAKGFLWHLTPPRSIDSPCVGISAQPGNYDETDHACWGPLHRDRDITYPRHLHVIPRAYGTIRATEIRPFTPWFCSRHTAPRSFRFSP